MGGWKTPEQAAAYWKMYRTTKLPYVERKCADCGFQFHPRGPQKRCEECQHGTCEMCGARFKRRCSTQRFCSGHCASSVPANVERITTRDRGPGPERSRLKEHPRARDSAEDVAWRRAVMARDDYTCQGCGHRGEQLQADHVQPVALRPDLRFDLENGRTLCHPCHKATPTHGWKGFWLKVRLSRCPLYRVIDDAMGWNAFVTASP